MIRGEEEEEDSSSTTLKVFPFAHTRYSHGKRAGHVSHYNTYDLTLILYAAIPFQRNPYRTRCPMKRSAQ